MVDWLFMSENSRRASNDRRSFLSGLLKLFPLAILGPSVANVEQPVNATLQPDLVSNTTNTFTTWPTLLPANQTAIVGPLDCHLSDEVGVSVYANRSGTLYVETGASDLAPPVNSSSWRLVDVLQVMAGVPANRVYAVTTPWMRLRYKNDGLAQTVFELVAVNR